MVYLQERTATGATNALDLQEFPIQTMEISLDINALKESIAPRAQLPQ